LLGELALGRERAARMAGPDVLREHPDEADLLEDRALVERIGPEISVEVTGAQVRDHLRRWHRADLYVLVRIHSGLGQHVAEQEIVHRVIEGHPELEALHLSRALDALVL